LDPYDRGSIWVVDLTKTACNRDVVGMVRDRWDREVNASSTTGATVDPWRVLLVDFGDDYYRGTAQCAKAINGVFRSSTTTSGKGSYVHYASRQTRNYQNIVHEKGEPASTPFTSYGKVRNLNYHGLFNGTVRVLRYGVQTDLVDTMASILTTTTASTSHPLDITGLPRPKDVVHFWNYDSVQKSTAFHRTFVS